METVRALVVEDDHHIRKLLSSMLRSWGIEVLEAHDASSLACAQPECPCDEGNACADILLTDQMMPGITGAELVRRHARKPCPIPEENRAILTAHPDPGMIREQAYPATFQLFGKPFDWNALRIWVGECKVRISPKRKLLPSERIVA